MIADPAVFSPKVAALRAGDSLPPETFAGLRRQALLEGCKWDAQVGDVETLAPFPLLLSRAAWTELAAAAEALAAETVALETAVLTRPELLRELALPRAVRQTLLAREPLSTAGVRVMRFDFHPTPDGWRLSEVNSDVPGGYTESSFFTQLMSRHTGAGQPAGDPARAFLDALTATLPPGAPVALLTAPGYMEDQQIMFFFARALEARGLRPVLANPAQLLWQNGRAHLGREPLAHLIRFYQGEWLARLPARFGWWHFFSGGVTPVTNPGVAVIGESKRLPLLWSALPVDVPAWRRWLPETRDPRDVAWQRDDGWLVKSAFCNTGDTVGCRDFRPAREWREQRFAVWLNPGNWVAQRRFNSVPLDTPLGPRHACLGVYTVNGTAAGAYARLAARPLVDFEAMDAALLIDDAL